MLTSCCHDTVPTRSYMTSQQSVGNAQYGSGPKKTKTSFINHENTMGEFLFPCGARETQHTFKPRYTVSKSVDPVTGNMQQWLGVNFVSKYDDDGLLALGRPPIELCLVVDISGSMSSSFDNDSSDGGGGWGSYNSANSKLEVAKRCVKAILQQLTENDAVSVILFNQHAHTLVPLTSCKKLNRTAVNAKIDAISTRGGTDLTNGFKAGMAMLNKKGAKAKATANGLKRVMFITDMESSPDDEASVLDIARKNAGMIHTTIVGVGVDLSVGTVQTLSNIPGCKYSSVASAEEFEGKVASEFPYDVTPIASHITVTLGNGYTFDKGYGSPEMNDLKPGSSSFAISSEFPIVSNSDRAALGALYVFKLQTPAEDGEGSGGSGGTPAPKAAKGKAALKGKANGAAKGKATGKAAASTAVQGGSKVGITSQWRDMDGSAMGDEQVIDLSQADSFGVKKAIALVRYVDLQSEYVLEDDEGVKPGESKAQVERELATHTAWIKRFEDEKLFLLGEMKACGDESLDLKTGNNKNVMETLNQIIGIEHAEIKRVTKEFTAALRVQTAEAESASAAGDVSQYPNEFLCSITGGLMIDPVMTTDGQTYERSAIEEWFARHPTGEKQAVCP